MDTYTKKFKLLPSTIQNKSLILVLSLLLLICSIDLSYAANATSSTQALHHAKFRVPGASCLSCIRRLEREIRQTQGVLLAHAVKTSPFVMEIYYDSNILKLNTIFDSLKDQGYLVSGVVDEPVSAVPTVATSKDTNADTMLKGLPAEAPPIEMP